MTPLPGEAKGSVGAMWLAVDRQRRLRRMVRHVLVVEAGQLDASHRRPSLRVEAAQAQLAGIRSRARMRAEDRVVATADVEID